MKNNPVLPIGGTGSFSVNVIYLFKLAVIDLMNDDGYNDDADCDSGGDFQRFEYCYPKFRIAARNEVVHRVIKLSSRNEGNDRTDDVGRCR